MYWDQIILDAMRIGFPVYLFLSPMRFWLDLWHTRKQGLQGANASIRMQRLVILTSAMTLIKWLLALFIWFIMRSVKAINPDALQELMWSGLIWLVLFSFLRPLHSKIHKQISKHVYLVPISLLPYIWTGLAVQWAFVRDNNTLWELLWTVSLIMIASTLILRRVMKIYA
jgi:hypothetical protein